MDVGRIRKLPIEEHAKIVSSFNDTQLKYYISRFPVNESQQSIKAVPVDYDFDDIRSGVDADEFFTKMKKMYLERK